MVQEKEMIISSTAVESSSGKFNVSLLQGLSIFKIVIAVVISLSVLISVGLSGAFIGIRLSPSPPVANPFSTVTFKNIPVVFNPTTNDLAVERGDVKDHLQIDLISVSEPKNGRVEWFATNKSVTFIPAKGFVGSEVFNYVIENDKRSSRGSINVTVVNRPPNLIKDVFQVPKNASFNLSVLKNDLDDDNDELFITHVPQETDNGSSKLETDGKVVIITPKPHSSGKDTFEYSASDGNATRSTTVTVYIENSPPIAKDDSFTVLMNSLETKLNVLENDLDENGDQLFISRIGPSDHGLFSIKEESSDEFSLIFENDPSQNNEMTKIIYTPKWGFSGQDAFDYSITDGFIADSDHPSAVVSLNIVNLPPVAKNYSIQIFKTDRNVLIPVSEKLAYDPNPFTCLSLYVSPAIRGSKTVRVMKTWKTVEYLGETKSYQDCLWSIEYTPEFNTSYQETIEYSVSDGVHRVTGFIHVTVVNRAPRGENAVVEWDKGCNMRLFQERPELRSHTQLKDQIPYPSFGIEKQIDLSQYVSDPDGDFVNLLSVNPFSMVSIQSINNWTVTFVREGCDFGQETQLFRFQDVQKNETGQITRSASLTLSFVNTPPVCSNFTEYFRKEDVIEGARICVVGDCFPRCGDKETGSWYLTIVHVETNSDFLTVDFNSWGYITVASRQSGSADIFYTVSDGDMETTASIRVEIENFAPTAKNTSVVLSYPETRKVSMTPFISDPDPYDRPVVVSIDPKNTEVFETNSGEDGIVEFEYVKVSFEERDITFESKENAPSGIVEYQLLYRISDQDPGNPLFAVGQVNITLFSRG